MIHRSAAPVHVPYLTTAQMVEVDRLMIEEFGIELIQMMENAGRNLAHLARHRFLDGDPRGKRIVVLAGRGGNGGGALVCARRLHNWGSSVSVVVTANMAQFAGVPAHQLGILRAARVPTSGPDELGDVVPDLIVDGVIGYSLDGPPRGPAAIAIAWANATSAPILSLDTPSGVDTTTGEILEPSIRATATMTLALPKEGLRARGVPALVGELYLADISVPPALYSHVIGVDVGPLFAMDDIVRIA